ncbi:unnamed protein product [Meganyctiphanes norvegica]|uniref:MYND-type domain-containing protein n=1 Tax=Meganyctiphanes norvegica TaxID=48144 RepID=A0AAV2QD84_MEGNR
MELPICKGAYTNEGHLLKASFMMDVLTRIRECNGREYRTFFVGRCYFCHGCPPHRLLRCGGCQLVAYCSRDCQKHDRNVHKYVCKEFPVHDGKNVLYTTRPWKEHITGLRERAACIPYAETAAKPIFCNPRVCRNCREARQDILFNCVCASVSYCSKMCEEADKQHKKYCSLLDQIVRAWANPPSSRDNSHIPKFKVLTAWSDVIYSEYLKDGFKYSIHNEWLSYSMSLLYALQMLPKRRLGYDNRPLEELTTLEVHVVTSNPPLSSEYWEMFMHQLPKLKQLNVVYIIQGRPSRRFVDLNMEMNLHRCVVCIIMNRVITYSVHQMQYHLFFSSEEYTEPNVVVVYGNEQEMSSSEEGYIHSEISYRNMTHSRSTVLVLTDITNNLVSQGVRAVKTARSINLLVSPQIKQFRGFSSNRTDIDSDTAVINEKNYFACLRRK